MRRLWPSRAPKAAVITVALGFPWALLAQEPPADGVRLLNPSSEAGRDLQLEVFINDTSTELIGAFKQRPDGTLAATPDEAREVGLRPAQEAIGVDGLVTIDQLAGVSYRLDEAGQKLYVTATDAARAPRVIDVAPKSEEETLEPQSGYGGVLNYTLFASSEGAFLKDVAAFQGLSGVLDGRLFSPYGTLSQSLTATPPTGSWAEPRGSIRPGAIPIPSV